jgi:hypothetical protein
MQDLLYRSIPGGVGSSFLLDGVEVLVFRNGGAHLQNHPYKLNSSMPHAGSAIPVHIPGNLVVTVEL